ncbi:hypothetical protein [uncultured Alsobacter sp.]|uniref:hypothetical protein n=1 Tax=uncultured Alsobacter sp. TaxID=1748258 RepID=UPI0025D02DCC|nr:hypothetical protein [uncultured Alsobacter sp.]
MNRSSSRPSTLPSVLVLAVTAGVLGGCSTLGLGSDEPRATVASSSGTSSFSEFFRNGGSTVPPPAAPVDDDFECPSVEILDGGAAMRQVGGSDVRNQVSLGEVARECRAQPGGQIAIKVGVEGRVLLGPAGSPGTFTAPVRVVIKRGDKVLVSRLQRATATVPSGDVQARFVVIEDNMIVPRQGEELSISVGLDPSGRGGDAPRKRKRG